MESVLFRNICNEIMRECHNKRIRVKRVFISYYVKLLLIDPKWNISVESEEINRLDLQAIVKSVITFLSNELNPALVTLQIQQLFDSSFDTHSNIVRKHRAHLFEKLSPLKKEIIAAKSMDEADLQNLYRKIVMYLTLTHGLGNPCKENVYNEAKVALHSIFWMNELKTFIKSEYKEYELESLANLLMGIRLFNRDCKKSGYGIEDVPSLLTEALEIINHELQKSLKKTMDSVNELTTALDLCYLVENFAEKDVLTCVLPPNVTQHDVENMKDLLVCFRQNEIYIRKIMTEVEEIGDRINYIFAEFQSHLEEAHKTIHYKIAVAATQVYPHFVNLAFSWHKMQDQAIYLSMLRQILTNLDTYMKHALKNENVLQQIIGNNSILTDAERLQLFSRHRMTKLECSTNFLQASEIPNFDQTTAQFLGFCVWKLVESRGALIPGNPNLGAVEHLNKYYVFSCIEGALAFQKSPETYINAALDLVRKKTQLINFLQVQDQLETIKTVSELIIKSKVDLVAHDVPVQTVLHPIQANIDYNYKWNVWDLKRQALILADISKRKTHSTQTDEYTNKNSIRLQTQQMVDKICQTKKDNYTNVPTQSNFIYGLRGRKDEKQFIITLTRPVDEE